MGNVACKIYRKGESCSLYFIERIRGFFYGLCKRSRKVECLNEKEEINEKGQNYLMRSLRELSKQEIGFLVIAVLFLGINAYTNLSFPRIMGECIDDNTNNTSVSNTFSSNRNSSNHLVECSSYSFASYLFKKISFFNGWNVWYNDKYKWFFKYARYFLLGGFASYFRVYFTNKCSKCVETRMKKQIHKKILEEDSEEFREYKSSDYLVGCTFDEINYSSKELISFITQSLRYMNSIIGGLCSMISISPFLTKICVLIIPTYGALSLAILKRLGSIKVKTSKLEEEEKERLSDTLQKKSLVTICGNEVYEHDCFLKKQVELGTIYNSYITGEALFYAFLNIGTNVVICTILFFGKVEMNNGKMNHGQLISFVAYSSMLGLGIAGISRIKKDLNVLTLSLKKIYQVIDFTKTSKNESYKKVERENDADSPMIQNQRECSTKQGIEEGVIEEKSKVFHEKISKGIKPLSIEGTVRFENVNFSYRAFDKNKKEVLKNVNFEIKAKEKVAIIGKSGCGKSTLWKLLTQEYEYDGNIYIDNFNIQNINKTHLKKYIVSINDQECTILNRSLYENLRYAMIPFIEDQQLINPKAVFEEMKRKEPLFEKFKSCYVKLKKRKELVKYIKETFSTKEQISLVLQNTDKNSSECIPVEEKFLSFVNLTTEPSVRMNKKEETLLHHKIEEVANKIVSGNLEYPKDHSNRELCMLLTYYRENTPQVLEETFDSKENVVEASIDVLCNELDMKKYIASLHEDIHTLVHNNTMSTGQKQRISLIRSLIKDTPIYIFDETTSALDESNVEKVYKTINSLLSDKTVIYITHFPQILKQMNKIIIVEDGEIKKIGTYDQIKKSSGFSNIFTTHSTI